MQEHEVMVINTPTMDDYINVVLWALSNGRKWSSGNTDINTQYWYEYGSNTNVMISSDTILYGYMDRSILDAKQFYRDAGIDMSKMFAKRYNLL